MTDRELLELAAKAAGINGEWARWHQAYDDAWIDGIDTGARFLWNPLTDDGDALRLAVKLELCLDMRGDVWVGQYPIEQGDNGVTEKLVSDHMAAVRRAIVRVAAEIGRAKS